MLRYPTTLAHVDRGVGMISAQSHVVHSSVEDAKHNS